jgi:cytochrome b
MSSLALGRDASVSAATTPVWDPFIRLFHWSLVGAVAVALVTSLVLPPTWVTPHVIAGTTAVALVLARVVWGLLGPAAARFSRFVQGPREIAAHIGELRRGSAARHLGHNPLGGAMIVALLAGVAALGLTGVVTLGGSLKSGPLAFATSFTAGETARAVHQLIAYGLLALISLHVAGAIFESLRTRDNLVRAMVDGRKERRPGDIVPRPAATHPVLATMIVTILLAAAAAAILTLMRLPAAGVPTAPLDPLYADECGACHAPFHPSLAPAATWSAIMDHLDEHFGEGAELGPDETRKIRDYLVANAAEAYDTKAANRFRRRDPTDPLRITATPFWQRQHGSIPDQVFAAKAVASRGNCSACHQDAAAGLFSPESIHIPEEALP